MHTILSLISAGIILSGQASSTRNNALLTDNNPNTCYTGTTGKNQLIFDTQTDAPVLCYKLFSSSYSPSNDPSNWTLKGSNDEKNWVVVDKQKKRHFCSRFQEILCKVKSPANYKTYMLEVKTIGGDTLKIADVQFFTKDLLANWTSFNYPKVNFKDVSPHTKGSKTYHQLVQNPNEYVKYHAQKVAEILFFKDSDPMYKVGTIDYTLEDYDGISAKGGEHPDITIVYSTRHVEKTAAQSLNKLDYETRGVLYHELTHAYQYEPKGVGDYSTNKVFWACIEGMADAVRTEAGLFDIKKQRKPGGTWMDGYRTTGFFIHWLTTKDPDAIRKFNQTVRDLEVWSFDKAIKTIFGEQASIEGMWKEYQDELISTTK